METVEVDKQAILDLAKLIEEVQDRIESLELAANPEFMESLKKSKEEIKNRDFAKWDEL